MTTEAQRAKARQLRETDKRAMAQIIVNANAPIVELTITVDNRYNPPAIGMKSSRPMPAKIVEKTLLFCAANLIDQELNAEMKAAGAAPIPPNLPDPDEKVE